MDPYTQIAESIVQKLVLVLEGMALDRARKVSGLQIDAAGHVQSVQGGAATIESLIKEYQQLLGPASVSFARDAAHPIIKQHPDIEIPQALR